MVAGDNIIHFSVAVNNDAETAGLSLRCAGQAVPEWQSLTADKTLALQCGTQH